MSGIATDKLPQMGVLVSMRMMWPNNCVRGPGNCGARCERSWRAAGHRYALHKCSQSYHSVIRMENIHQHIACAQATMQIVVTA